MRWASSSTVVVSAGVIESARPALHGRAVTLLVLESRTAPARVVAPDTLLRGDDPLLDHGHRGGDGLWLRRGHGRQGGVLGDRSLEGLEALDRLGLVGVVNA